MTEIKIQSVKNASREAFIELKKFQDGKIKQLKLGDEKIDCHLGGLLPGDVVIIGGKSGTGKSEKLYEWIDNALEKEINPFAENYVSLEYSMEMKMLNKLMRAIHNRTGKKKSDIISEVFTDEEKEVVKKYSDTLQDNRRYIVQEPVSPDEFYRLTREFCIKHKDKGAILISSDHILLHKGSDKQGVLEKMTEYVNQLKLEFGNIFFILVSQLNRTNYPEVKEKSNEMRLTSDALYGSSFMEQLASYICLVENPFKRGVTDYLKVNKERYSYLENFFTAEDKHGRVSFETLGNLFFYMTKVRDSDNQWKDLFVEKMKLNEDQLELMKMDADTRKPSTTMIGNLEIELPDFGDDIPF